MLICEACGNKEFFEQKTHLRIYASEVRMLNEHGDITDHDSYEEYDTDLIDEEDIICSNCNEPCDDEHTERDIIQIIYSHTKKDGSWSKEELEEEERDERILQEAAIKNI